jgi:hypothetical protein
MALTKRVFTDAKTPRDLIIIIIILLLLLLLLLLLQIKDPTGR